MGGLWEEVQRGVAVDVRVRTWDVLSLGNHGVPVVELCFFNFVVKRKKIEKIVGICIAGWSSRYGALSFPHQPLHQVTSGDTTCPLGPLSSFYTSSKSRFLACTRA